MENRPPCDILGRCTTQENFCRGAADPRSERCDPRTEVCCLNGSTSELDARLEQERNETGWVLCSMVCVLRGMTVGLACGHWWRARRSFSVVILAVPRWNNMAGFLLVQNKSSNFVLAPA
eukprot:1683422-Rhodomonas_salina.2